MTDKKIQQKKTVFWYDIVGATEIHRSNTLVDVLKRKIIHKKKMKEKIIFLKKTKLI